MKKRLALIIVALSVMLCGCGGYREIDRGYLVTCIGISTKDGAVNILAEVLSSSYAAEKSSDRVVLSGSGESVSLAYKDLKDSLVKPLYFEQLGAVVLENTDFQNSKEIDGVKQDVYLVKTDDIKSLFESDTPSGVLGYDIITLIKTQSKQKKIEISNQLYNSQNKSFDLPIVNFIGGKLIIKVSEKNVNTKIYASHISRKRAFYTWKCYNFNALV